MTLAIVSALLVILAAAGYRTHMLPLGPAFALLAAGLLGTGASALLHLYRLVQVVVRHRPGRTGRLVVGLVLSLAVLSVPLGVVLSARLGASGLPAIHDITTDTGDPPVFVDLLPLREGAANTAVYGGPAIAAQQRQGYPDLRPLTLTTSPDQTFDAAMAAMTAMGWEPAGSNRAQGRIEATDTTFWFGFKDDVVVRIRPDGPRTRVDVRSASRVGLGDVGTNARRIRTLTAALASTPR